MNIKKALVDVVPEAKETVLTLLPPTLFHSVRFLCRQMEGLKAKLAKMREELEESEKREQEAKKKTRDARERIFRAEDDINAKKTKVKRAKANLEKIEDVTDEKLDRLERLNDYIHATDSAFRKLEKKELVEDGMLGCLESRYKSQKIFVEEAEQRYRESVNKLMLVERETQKINARIRDTKSKEASFKHKLADAERSVRQITNSIESKQAKRDEFQERIRRLTEKKEKMLLVAENTERKEKQLRIKLIPLKEETRQMKESDEGMTRVVK